LRKSVFTSRAVDVAPKGRHRVTQGVSPGRKAPQHIYVSFLYGRLSQGLRPGLLYAAPSGLIRTACALALFAITVLFASTALGAAPKPTLKSVGQKVYCTCGCVTTLEHCPHPPSECSMRAQMEALILKDIDAGKDEQAIVQDFVDRYGIGVLAAPPAKGFNLTAWILPGVGLIVGLVAVIVIVRRMRETSAKPAETTAPSIDPKVLAAVEEEMRTAGLGTRE